MNFTENDLIIKKYKSEILESFQKYHTTIIKGPTGCGKSTYIPNLLFEEGNRVAIIEPRRIAVKGLYNTLKENIPRLSYKMRFDNVTNHNVSDRSYVVIYTDGAFINEILYNNVHKEFDYIILDEVHERSARLDLLIGVLKTINNLKNSFKLVLMSATIDTKILQDYFSANVVNVYGKRFKTVIFYEEEAVSDYIIECFHKVKEIINVQNEYKKKLHSVLEENIENDIVKKENNSLEKEEDDEFGKREILFNTNNKKKQNKLRCDNFNLKNIEKKKFKNKETIFIEKVKKEYEEFKNKTNNVNFVNKNSKFYENEDVTGDILIFLPGEEDINDLYKLLRKLPQIKPHKIYGSLSDSEQQLIFSFEKNNDPSNNDRILTRVILSTNVCETSLTIPGIKFVIDTGLYKEKIVKENIQYLVLQEISKESADQRLGRCSRVSNGFCYRIYTREAYKNMKSIKNIINRIFSCNKNTETQIFDSSILQSQSKVLNSSNLKKLELDMNESEDRSNFIKNKTKNTTSKTKNKIQNFIVDKNIEYKKNNILLTEIERCDMAFIFLVMAGMGLDFLRFEYINRPNFYNSKYAIKYLLDINCIAYLENKEDKSKMMEIKNFNDDIDDIFNSEKIESKNEKELDIGFFIITDYGKKVLSNPLDVYLSHFYECCKKKGIQKLGAILTSLIGQENYNFLGNKDEDKNIKKGSTEQISDIHKLIGIFIEYNNIDSFNEKKIFCKDQGISYVYMEKAILSCKNILFKNKRNLSALNLNFTELEPSDEYYKDIETLERCFSDSFKHNLSVRQKDGSYIIRKNINNSENNLDNKIYIHPCSGLFRKKEKYIVFVDIFCSSKKYARIVGKYFTNLY